MRRARPVSAWFLLLAACGRAEPPREEAPPRSVVEGARKGLVLLLESDRRTYGPRDRIRLRLAMENRGAGVLSFEGALGGVVASMTATLSHGGSLIRAPFSPRGDLPEGLRTGGRFEWAAELDAARLVLYAASETGDEFVVRAPVLPVVDLGSVVRDPARAEKVRAMHEAYLANLGTAEIRIRVMAPRPAGGPLLAVRFRQGVTEAEIEAWVERRGYRIAANLGEWTVEVPGGRDPERLAAELRADPLVLTARPR